MGLTVLSAGAAQALVGALARESGVEAAGRFGAVGAIREKFLAGEPCDLLILTHAQVAELLAQGRVAAECCSDLGVVRTSIAVRSGDAQPDVSDADGLRSALLAADAIYYPDPQKATAGIHFAKVLEALGIRAAVESRLRPHPDGMAAMRALAQAGGHPVGCTQATEILATPGVALAAPLPKAHELATVYTAAVGARAADPRAAREFIGRLAGASSAGARAAAGFEGVAIRRATGADTAAARELVYGVLGEYGLEPEPGGVDADLEDLDAAYFARRGSFDAAIDAGGRLAACCGMKPMEDGRIELRKMYVRKDARGQGLGRRLLDRALAFARARGFARVDLETASVLEEAIALYRKAGFLPRPGKLETCRCDQAYYLDL